MKKNKKKVSVIIVNWNNINNLKECLYSLKKIKYKNIEIIIVDNGSKDGTLEYLAKEKKSNGNLIVIRNKKNLGFAEGNNIGYSLSTGEYILFLNNDTIVDDNFLGPLVEKLHNPSIGGVQPKILSYPRKDIIDSIGSYLLNSGFLYHFGHNKPDAKKYNRGAEIFSMKGACMLLKKDVIEKVGLFDKNYFAYFEETDLCHRVWLSGSKIYYVSHSVIYHKGGETAKELDVSFIQFHSYKNRIWTYLKNLEIKTIIKIIPVHILFCEVITILYIFTLKFSLAFAVQKAIVWNLFNIDRLLIERKKIKAIRKVPDKFFTPNITRRVRISYYYHLFVSSLSGYKD
ncbi:MAG: glycosyltransferase family 2 protein [Patescibacteria group bacterium]|nr:glycosyltransferase family 2 protein [Patescibacteria group bacterium]